MDAAPEQPQRGDLLLVDDTPENIGFLSAMLKARGYRARAVPSGALALRAALAEPPDLVLLDITMPGMDGFEVCRRFKAEPTLRDVPIIFLSALSETFDKVKTFEVGGVDYVTKPFKVEEIGARIETHLSIRRLQASLRESNASLSASYARLDRLEQVRQAMVQMIVHDLKSPIAAIQAYAQLAQSELPAGSEGAEYLDGILACTPVLTRMVMDVLDVARAEEAGLTPRLAPVDLGALLGEVERELQGLARGVRRELTLELAPDLPARVTADRDLVRRVVQNVVDNSLKYAPRGSRIRVSAAADGPDHYRVTIRDEGKGIPAEMRERIFEPYARLDRDLEAGGRVSRGLGLAFCRLAAEALGGRIWVEDNVPVGSAFHLRLPVQPGPAAAAAEATSAAAPAC